jgi:hypothetical protein
LLFQQAAYAFNLENLWFHSDDCGGLNFPPEVGRPVPYLALDGLRFVSDRERWEDREARERLDAAMAATLPALNPKLVEEERHRLEAFAEAKRKADAVKEDDVGDAGPSTTMINIDNDSSCFDWDED